MRRGGKETIDNGSSSSFASRLRQTTKTGSTTVRQHRELGFPNQMPNV